MHQYIIPESAIGNINHDTITAAGWVQLQLRRNTNMIASIPAMPMDFAASTIQAAPGFAPVQMSQPMYVADYTGLPGGGHYDQGFDGSTIYLAPDASQWRMNPDGSFNRI